MGFLRVIPEGGVWPSRWHGAAYEKWHPTHVEVVCAPVPFNVLIGLGLRFYRRLRGMALRGPSMKEHIDLRKNWWQMNTWLNEAHARAQRAEIALIEARQEIERLREQDRRA